MICRPLRDVLLLAPEAMETESAGGIILPDICHAYTGVATVLAVGPLVRDVQVGEKVIYDHDQAAWVGEQEFLLPVDEIIGVCYEVGGENHA